MWGCSLSWLTDRTAFFVAEPTLNMMQGMRNDDGSVLGRLQSADGATITGADTNFYLHEITEAGMMRAGMSYEAAHAAALAQHGVSQFALYSPAVVRALPQLFSNAWRAYWGIP